MLEDLPKARSIELDRAFKALMAEEQQRQIDDRRSCGRLPFVRPLSVSPRGITGQHFEAFSRNISPLGLGVVSREAFKMGDVATIEIHRFNRPPIAILAECRWADNFGTNWYFSGWSFLSVARD
jgi:hypothetical protein